MRAFILAVLFSYQQVAIGAFTLVQCVKVEDRKVLYIQGEILCDTWWQTAIEIYIWLSVIPTFLILCHAAFYVQSKEMSIKIFILACLFPLPVTIIYHMARSVEVFRSKRSEKIKLEKIQSCRDIEDVLLQSSSKTVISEQLQIRKPEKSTFDQIKRCGLFDLESKSRMQSKASTDTLGQIYVSSDSDTDIGNEYETDLNMLTDEDSEDGTSISLGRRDMTKNMKCSKTKIQKYISCREEIGHSLLHHYRDLSLFGFKFTWLGIHKLYILLLVACKTYITDPLVKLMTMTVLLLAIGVLNTLVRPYKKQMVNTVATLSYAASLLVAIMGLCKAMLEKFGCQNNCSFEDTFLKFEGISENILLLYVPAGAVAIWLLNMGVQKCRGKDKKE